MMISLCPIGIFSHNVARSDNRLTLHQFPSVHLTISAWAIKKYSEKAYLPSLELDGDDMS